MPLPITVRFGPGMGVISLSLVPLVGSVINADLAGRDLKSDLKIVIEITDWFFFLFHVSKCRI